MWVIKSLILWSEVTLEPLVPGFRCPVSLEKPKGGEIGYLSVYENYDDALKAADGRKELLMQIERLK